MDLESISVWASTAWRRALTNVEAVLSIWSFQISVSCGKMSVRTCNLNCKLNWWATKRVTEWESTSRSKKEQSPLIKKYKRRSNYTGSNKQVIIFFFFGWWIERMCQLDELKGKWWYLTYWQNTDPKMHLSMVFKILFSYMRQMIIVLRYIICFHMQV